ncbi:MAG: hypothetical protein P8R43_04625, partial [Planctomycetota bacterium]|nr:hypothetical protein [Planctomycetota bacterium]
MLNQPLAVAALFPLLLGSASGAQDGGDVHPWVAKVRVPAVSFFELNFGYSTDWFDAGEGLAPTFEGEPEELLSEAAERLDGGEMTAQVLHQLVFGLVGTDQFEEGHIRLLDGCFQLYAAEVEEDAEDFELRLKFASALSLGARLLRSRELLDGCFEQYESALELEPDDHRVWSAMSGKCFGFYLRTREVKEDPSLLDQALEYAEAAVDAAPKELGPRLRLAGCQMGLVAARQAEDAVSLIADAMEELADGARSCEGGEEVAACAEICWTYYRTIPLLLEATSGEAAAPSPSETGPGVEVIEARLEDDFEGLSKIEDGDLKVECARALWIAHLLAGDESEDEARLEQVQDHGLEEAEAYRIGVRVPSMFGRPRPRLVEALVEIASADDDWSVLAAHFHRMGENAAALDALGELEAPTFAQDLAEAILQLRLGRTEEGLERLEELGERLEEAEEMKGGAAPLHHAHGVALALAGQYEQALVQLEVAAELMEDEEALEEVLEAVRAELEEEQTVAGRGLAV